MSNTLNNTALENLVKVALAEDIGSGDATTLSTVPENLKTKAVFLAKEDCVCAGLPVAAKVFSQLDKDVKFTAKVSEGDFCTAGTIIAEVFGDAQALLTGERTALNYLQRMSGIATTTQKYVEKTNGSKTQILDTRKTTPGLRMLEKYSVAMGGATNHRFGLYDRVMIKDNHRELAALSGNGGITRSVNSAREKYPDLEVEVEADNLDEVKEAAEINAEYILLDNMSNEEVKEAIKIIDGRSQVEVSGGITIERIESLAAIPGVDFISVGALTHCIKSVDISLDIQIDTNS
ncbi:MAG: carboxylating nicotinate-nucleotide diphosphorylase [Lentisphaeraceae bacterium]|nr:carboxylating nicotinate-nucleotide diphosphorylase [Lentisphaeraceae bacterium]